MVNIFTCWRPSYSIEDVNFLRFGLALLTIGPMIFQEVLKSYISPKDLNSIITEVSSPQFWKMLNPQEKSWLAEATSHGYTNFDVYFCDKLWKFVRLKSDEGFSERPEKENTSRNAECIEIKRIMRLHDIIYDNVENCSIPTRKFEESWTVLTDICTKMQLVYPNAKNFSQELDSLECRHFTDEERQTICGRLKEMKDQGKQLKPGKDQRNVSHAGLFWLNTKKVTEGSTYGNYEDRELLHAKNLDQGRQLTSSRFSKKKELNTSASLFSPETTDDDAFTYDQGKQLIPEKDQRNVSHAGLFSLKTKKATEGSKYDQGKQLTSSRFSKKKELNTSASLFSPETTDDDAFTYDQGKQLIPEKDQRNVSHAGLFSLKTKKATEGSKYGNYEDRELLHAKNLDQGKQLASLQFLDKKELNTSASLFSPETTDDDAFTYGNFESNELQNAKNLGMRMQIIFIHIETHLHTLADTLQMFSKEKIYRVPKLSFPFLDDDKDSDKDSDSFEKGDQLPHHGIFKKEAKTEPHASATAWIAQDISFILEDVKDDLFLLSADVDAYVFEVQDQKPFHSPEELLDYLKYKEDFEGQINRIFDHRNIQNVKEEIEYHIQQMEEYVNRLSQEVEKMHLGDIISTERKDEKYARNRYGYDEYLSEKRQFLFQRCISFKEVWISVYSTRIREHFILLYDNVEQTDVSEGYPDKHIDLPIEPKGVVLLPDDRSQKKEHQSIHKGLEKMFIPKTRLAERVMEMNIPRYRSNLRKGLTHYLPRHNKLSHHIGIHQLYYRAKAMQNYLTMLGRIQRFNANDIKNEILLLLPKALDILPIIQKANNVLNLICTSCIRSVDASHFQDYESLPLLGKHWEKRMYETEERLYDERLECLTEKRKYYIYQIENNKKHLLEDTNWLRKYGLLFEIPRLDDVGEKLEALLRQLADFVEKIEKKKRDDCDDCDDKLRKAHIRIMPYMIERTKSQGALKEEFLKAHENQLHRLFLGLDSKRKIHICAVFKDSVKILPKEFKGVPVVSKLRSQNNYLALKAVYNQKGTIQDDDVKEMESLLRLHTDDLMSGHSNLEILTTSASKFLDETEEFLEKPCFVMYCTFKGMIPMNENEFPKRLGKYDVDVREGMFFLFPGSGDSQFPSSESYFQNIQMGCNIGPKDEKKFGTLGGFVKTPNYGICFLTCAHVLHDIDVRNTIPEASNKAVVQPSSLQNNSCICGKEIKNFFGTENGVTIDASLVKVDPITRIPDRGNFAGLTVTDLEYIGLDSDRSPEYKNGAIKTFISNDEKYLPIIKCGTATGITRGSLRPTTASVRMSDVEVTLPLNVNISNSFTYKHQYEILSVGNAFASRGDSGAFVFLLDKSGELHCIGMLVGGTTCQTFIVTPIGDILDKFNISHQHMHIFENIDMQE